MQPMVNKINEVRCRLGLAICKIGLVFALLLVLGACVSNPTNRTNLADLYDNTMDAYERKEYLTAEHGLQMLSTRVPAPCDSPPC